jgi:hypothetical protein
LATDDTKIFRTKAVGLKVAGAMLNRGKTAIYPPALAEYRFIVNLQPDFGADL